MDVFRLPASAHTSIKTRCATLFWGLDEYVPLPELGGRRRPRPDLRNTVWRNKSFRGYADYMETEGFRAGIERLLELTRRRRTAFMCAEAVWWRCHRSLIADYLKAEGICVRHIIDGRDDEIHPYTSAARFRDGKLSYSPGGVKGAGQRLSCGAGA